MRGWILAAALLSTPAAAQQAPKEQPRSVWRVSATGEAEHLQSGLRCPPAMGASEFVGPHTFDGFGLDVSCGYNTATAFITLYLTRGQDAADGMAKARGFLEQNRALAGVRLVSDGRVRMGGLDWLRAEYAEEGVRRSDIWITDLGGWALKYRVTYPPAAGDEVASVLEALTAQVRATAGAHIALCARSLPPRRDGKPIRGETTLRNLAMTSGLVGAAGSADDEGSTPVPITYCVEDPIVHSGNPMLAWRGVLPDGADARVDRLSLMTMNDTPALEIASDDLGNFAAGGATPGRWVASLRSEGRTSVYGYFNGRPPAKAAADLLARMKDGKAPPLVSYGGADTSVTIHLPPR